MSADALTMGASQGDGPDSRLIAPDALRVAENGAVFLVGGRCGDCGAVMFPLPEVCVSCASEHMHPEDMPREGVLYSYTRVHVGAARWRKPFALGYIDLPNGVRLFSHLEEEGERRLEIDQAVEVGVAQVGQEPDGLAIMTFVFRPAGGAR